MPRALRSTAAFDSNVFINCPFDDAYAPILEALVFCLVFVGLRPRLASESLDSGEVRLEKIIGLIENAKYSIHDLSRCQAVAAGEYARLNMPFELGVDHGCRLYGGNGRDQKRILVLEEEPYRYQATISDLAGWDIRAHKDDHIRALKALRNWLSSETSTNPPAPGKIVNAYEDYQATTLEALEAEGWTSPDLREMPISEKIERMREWCASNPP